jgi:thioesterase domain-containing protein
MLDECEYSDPLSQLHVSINAVEAYLHEHIPLSGNMVVRVVCCDESGVTPAAPLEPNINHRHTMFGGSVSALAIRAAWTWLHT